MRIKMLDAIGIGLIVTGIAMTVLNLATARGHSAASSVESITLQEISPHGGTKI